MQEAVKSREALERSLANAVQRYAYYERLLGRPRTRSTSMPDWTRSIRPAWTACASRSTEPALAHRGRSTVDIAQRPSAIQRDGCQQPRGRNEMPTSSTSAAQIARTWQDVQLDLTTRRSAQRDPDVLRRTSSPSASAARYRSAARNLAQICSGIAARPRASRRSSSASRRAGRPGSAATRAASRTGRCQSNLAAGEINQIFKQLRAAQIREAMAEREWTNHQQQMTQAEDDRAVPDRRGTQTRQDAPTGLLRLAAPGGPRPVRRTASSWRSTSPARPSGRCSTSSATRASTFLRSATWPGKEGLLAGEKLLPRPQADGAGLPRAQPPRVRADQAREPAASSTRSR